MNSGGERFFWTEGLKTSFDESQVFAYNAHSTMKKFSLLIFLTFVLLLSCETVPTQSEMEFLLDLLEVEDLVSLAPTPEIAALMEEVPPEELPLEGLPFNEHAFDPHIISDDLYEGTKADIQDIIQRLNSIIRGRNYNAWLEYLSDSYLEEINSPGFLDEKTEELHRRNQLVAAATGRNPRTIQKVVLRTPRDYFDNVVVPSRANDRVDDIDFISETKIRAYTVNNRGVRLILYDLEIIGDDWKIIG